MKQSRWVKGMWLPAVVLATLVLWLGCEQKGDISPTASHKRVLTFIDTVIVDPQIIGPGETAAVHARILSETNEPAESENVRFSVTRGSLLGGRTDTTVVTDRLGWARTSVTAPADTGSVLLRTELLSMSEQWASQLYVSTSANIEGILTVWSDSDTLFADNGVSRTIIYARLRNETHNPIPGVMIYFSTNVGSVTQAALTDSLTGTAQATLVSTTETGPATVIAHYGATTDTAHVLFLTPAAASLIEVTSSRAQITAGSDSSVITARVFDTNNLPVVDNTVVFFSTTQGTLSRLTARTVNGMATTVLFASRSTGNATVSATTGASVAGNTQVMFLPGPAAAIILNASADTLFADNSSEATIVATVMDAFGNAVMEGTPVGFTAYGGTVTEVATVDAGGNATASFRAGLIVGPAAITASQLTVQASVSIYLQPTIAASITLTANPQQMTANGAAQSSLRAAVLDAQSRPVSDGTPVLFYANRGTVSAMAQSVGISRSDDAAWENVSVERTDVKTKSVNRFASASKADRISSPTNSIFTTTTVNGYAYAVVASSTVAGSDTVTASVQSLRAEQVLSYNAGPAARIIVTPGTTELPADGISSTAITCQVTDAFGNAISGGVHITVTATSGQVVPNEGYTNTNGIFITNLVTSRQRGVCAVIASCNGAVGYGQIAFTAPAVVSVGLLSESTVLLANGISSTTLTAVALDAYNLPVQGETVVWSISGGSGRLFPMTAVTDSLGRATALYYSGASRLDEQQTVTAQVGDYADSRVIRLLGITLQVWTDAAQLPADGNTTTNANVLVRETTSGQAVVGASVRFAATSGTIALSGTTGGSGIATALYRSSSQSGNVEITMVYGDTLRAQTALRLTGTEADTLVVSLGQNELLADGVSSTTVTAVVYNEGGQRVANTPVLFTANSAGSCVPTVVNSDENGVAVSTYYSAALNSDQQVSVDAAIERDNDQKPLLLRGVSLSAEAATSALAANGTSTCEVRIELRRSATQVGIPNTAVQLGTTLGTIPASVTTDASGVARVTFTAGSVSGTAYIIARFGNVLTDTVSLTLFQPSATVVSANAELSSLLGNGTDATVISTIVLDQLGNPLQNAIVTWSLSGSGTLYSPVSVTNAAGIASNMFTAHAMTTDNVTRVIARLGSAVDTVTISTRGVTLDLTADAVSIPANGVAEAHIIALLRETTSMVGITYAPLYFGTSLGSISADVVTDEWGRVEVNLQAGRTSGIATVVCRYGNLLTDTVQVNLYTAAPYRIQTTPNSDVLHADGLSNTNIRAVVYDAMNVVLQDVPVSWSSNFGQISNASMNTGTGGWADARITMPASNEDRLVIVTVNAGSVVGTDTVVARGISVSISATPDMVIADGSSTSQIRAHVYETTTFVAVYLGAVTFGTTLGTIPNLATTDASGIASVPLRSATTTGTAVVTVSYGNLLSAQTNVMFSPSTPTTLSLTASPTVLLADNISMSTLTAVVTDQSGNPVPNGTQVRFSIPPQSGSLENLRTTTSGVAVNTLTSSSTPDTVQVIAWAESNPNARDSVIIIYKVGLPAVVTLSAQSDTLPANGIAVDTITAHVTDAVGHVLSNVEVRFTTTIGNITSSQVTDLNGNARVAYSSSATGTAQVSATAGNAVGYYTVYLIPGGPNSISMDYLPNSVGVRASGRNETLLITATVRDANNNPVIDGTPVYFNITSSPGQGDFLSSTGPIPTINGRATVSYNSGTRSGSVRIRAICEGISAVSTEILIYAGPPFIEDIHFGCETSHMSVAPAPCSMFGMDFVGDSVTIVALVGDRYNNPVTPGTAVYFTTSGGVITTATGYTDSLGFARVKLYSGNPLPSIPRWMNTLSDPNIGGSILCHPVPPRPGVAKVLATSAGVDANGDSVTVWATTDVVFEYCEPNLYLRSASVNGDPTRRTLYIGQNALIRIAAYDYNYWPLVYGSKLTFTASSGIVYPSEIIVGCPGDTTYTVSFFNNRTLTDEDAASPVLINLDTRQGDAYAFTETFTLLAELPPTP